VSATTREDGARCFHADAPSEDPQHGPTCYCGRPATRHIYYGTGCGNVCGIHARKILRRKRMRLAAPNLVEIKA
jgi:hypothetical protein